MPLKAHDALALLNNLDQPVFVVNGEGTIQAVNGAFEFATGHSAEEAEGMPARDLEADGSPAPSWQHRLQRLNPGETWEGLVLHRYGEKEPNLVRQTVTPIQDEDEPIERYAVLNLDLDQLSDESQEFQRGSLRDDLTDLPSTTIVHDRIQQGLDQLERDPDKAFTLLFIDLDEFERITENLGESIGERIIQTVARRLDQNVRPGDTTARSTATWLGIDEFVILLEEIQEPSAAETIVKRLMVGIREPLKVRGHELQLDATAGIVLGSSEYEDPETMIRDARTAMSQAREDGRDFSFFTASMPEAVRRRFEMESEIRDGLQSDQFVLYYQPIVTLESDGIEGFEAFIRWEHPQRGLLEPAEFLPVAESCGLIVPIGRWVLDEALGQLRSWRDQDRVDENSVMHVNHDPSELTESDFSEAVQTILAEHDLSPESLHLEIAEITGPNNMERLDHRVPNLSELGLRLGVDDFGSGTSAVEKLSQLSQWPIHYMKIARELIHEMTEDDRQRDLVRSIVDFARRNEFHLVAKGVEHEEEHRLLKEWDCPAAQGYYYARPMPADDIEDELEDDQPDDGESQWGKWGTI